MATTLTYTSLLADLRYYTERGGDADPISEAEFPRIINRTEREIARRLKILGLLTPMITAMVAGTSVYAKPDRWRQDASMAIGTGTDDNTRVQLYVRAYEYCRMYWPTSTERDVPEFYADYDYNHWLIVPTPVADYPWEIMMYMIPAMLDGSNETNWISIYAPDVLLNGCLKNCEGFLKDDPRIVVWKGQFDAGLSELNGEDLQRIIDRSATRQST